jgi:hypothetical protein
MASPERVMLVSEDGKDSRDNVERTLRDFQGDLTRTLRVLNLEQLVGTEGIAYWGNGPDSRAGRAATEGRTLKDGDLLATVKRVGDADCVVAVARVLAHVLVPDAGAYKTSLPVGNGVRRWIGFDKFTNDAIFVGPLLDVPPAQIAAVNVHLAGTYRRMGNRLPSETFDVLPDQGQPLLNLFFGDAAAAWVGGGVLPFNTEQQADLQALADDAELGDLGERKDGAFEDQVVNRRKHQRRVSKQGFQMYGRTCAACGDQKEWRVQFAHLVPYGHSAEERWYCGLPLCANHHLDLDSRRLVLALDGTTWEAGDELTLEQLGVTADVASNLGNQFRPSKKVLKHYYAWATQQNSK